jgi:hypothetical protein
MGAASAAPPLINANGIAEEVFATARTPVATTMTKL